MVVDQLLPESPEVNGKVLELRAARPRLVPGRFEPRESPLRARPAPTLVSTVAHELRSPLAAVVTASELLVRDFELLDKDQILGMLAKIHRGGLWMQGLVDNLLCAASIGEGRFQVHPQPVNLVDLVMEMRPLLESLLGQKAQHLQVSFDGELSEVSADARRVGQVLVNLISNASKFSGFGTTLEVSLSAEQTTVRLSVADRGPGVREEIRERVFEPFFRASSAAQFDADGLGLGLAIVKSIVQAHGGRIGVENRAGGGARFWFELPAEPVAWSTPAERQMTEGGTG
jgi:two-component system, OmpR family, sensor histidine kinase KdpD